MSSAEELARKFDEGDEVPVGSGGKHKEGKGGAGSKHAAGDSDTRRIVQNAANGERKRKESGSSNK